MKEYKKTIAIVGSRETNDYWRKIAYKFSYEVAKNGITIISGLARGIDTVAHKAALDAGGETIAILGSGKDIIYPPENKDLAERIKKHGKVISPFPDGTLPLGKNFLARNKIIAEMSSAVLVVGGKRRSGTLSTAAAAANLGREVFVILGPINDPFSEVGYFLVENGARIVRAPSDLIEYVESLSY
ncbi:MAG: DNA-protecting protein DprA [Candidatus Woesebacteria bacterium]|nr:MAG: DNA-protecting protein DprA [Candidatus Woesebacteria bacterium]